MKHILPFGGGVNSGALLIILLKLNFRLDHIVFSDTGAEKPKTYAFLDEMDEYLKQRDREKIIRISVKDFAKTDLSAENIEEHHFRLHNLPAIAFGRKSCSVRWKIEPFTKWLKTIGETEKTVIQYIGYDYGEIRRKNRAQASKRFPENYVYPLIDHMVTRPMCIALLEQEGFKNIGKSSCYFCPNMRKSEVLELKRDYPDLFAKAVQLEVLKEEKDRAIHGADYVPTIRGLARSKKWSELEEDTSLPEFPLACDCHL